MSTRITLRPIQNDPGTSNWPSPANLQFWNRFWMCLGAAQGSTLVPKSVEVPWRNHEKILPKSDVEQIVIIIGKSSEIDAKMTPKVEQNSIQSVNKSKRAISLFLRRV